MINVLQFSFMDDMGEVAIFPFFLVLLEDPYDWLGSLIGVDGCWEHDIFVGGSSSSKLKSSLFSVFSSPISEDSDVIGSLSS